MNSGDITGIIKFALRDLFQEDSYLLYNDVSEWSICSKLAWHLLANLKRHQTIHAPMGGFSGWPDLTADIDFNRDRGPISKATRWLPPLGRTNFSSRSGPLPDGRPIWTFQVN